MQRLSRRLRLLPSVPLELLPQRRLQSAERAAQRLAKVAVLHRRRLRLDQQVRLRLRDVLEDQVLKRARPVQCLLRGRFVGSPHELHRLEDNRWRQRSSYCVEARGQDLHVHFVFERVKHVPLELSQSGLYQRSPYWECKKELTASFSLSPWRPRHGTWTDTYPGLDHVLKPHQRCATGRGHVPKPVHTFVQLGVKGLPIAHRDPLRPADCILR